MTLYYIILLCISFIVAHGFAFCVGAFAVLQYTITNIFMAMTNIDYIRNSGKMDDVEHKTATTKV